MTRCPVCDAENPAAARYCCQCGRPLVSLGFCQGTAGESNRQREGASADRALKTVTMMFCDVVDSTIMIANLAPELAMKLYQSATDAMTRAVVGAGGTIIRTQGDGVFAVFGAPIAQPDHALRACRAGFGIIAEVSSAFDGDAALSRHKPKVRVGINTAEVAVTVVRQGGRVDCELYGDEVNLAKRVESAAEADSVYLTDRTFTAIKGRADAAARGLLKPAGFSKSIQLYRLEAVGDDSESVGARSPFVGRAAELAALDAIMERAGCGVGSICFVHGEPGVGKTRLLEEWRPRALGAGALWLQGHSPPLSEHLSYWPIVEALRAFLAIGREADPPASWDRLSSALRHACPPAAEEDVAAYLALLLNVALPSDVAGRLPSTGSEAMTQQMLRALWHVFVGLVSLRPTILVIDDLQWVDASSLQVLKHISPISRKAPLVIVGLSRPDAEGLRGRRELLADQLQIHTELTLRPLRQTEGELLLDTLIPLNTTALRLKDLILSKADGNPFFIEEIARALKQAGILTFDASTGRWLTRVPLHQVRIPDSIKGVILARIDRLDDDLRETLRAASVIGRAFLYRVLRVISERGIGLEHELDELHSRDFIDPSRRSPELEYMFKHAVVQETVYASVFEERRRQIHLRIGECLEALFRDDLEPHFGVLAFHFVRAEQWDKAQTYLFKAADQAQRLAADAEALACLEQALVMLDNRGIGALGTLERARVERKLGQIRYRQGDVAGSIAHLHRGLRLLGAYRFRPPAGRVAAIVGEAIWHLALRLGHRLLPQPGAAGIRDEDLERLMIYEQLAWCHWHGNRNALLLVLLRTLNLGERRGHLYSLAIGCVALAYIFNEVGAVHLARRYQRRASRYATESGRAEAQALAMNLTGFHAWYTGSWDSAISSYEQGIHFATCAGDGNDWMGINAQQACLFFLRGELRRSFEIGRSMVLRARESAIAAGFHWGLLVQGRALFQGGFRSDGLLLIRKAITRAHRMPDQQGLSLAEGALALCLIADGQLEEARAVVRRSLAATSNVSRYVAMDLWLAVAWLDTDATRQGQGARGRRACQKALRCARVFSGGLPAALRIAGRLESKLGHHQRAKRLWEEGCDAARRIGARPELVAILEEKRVYGRSPREVDELTSLTTELVAEQTAMASAEPFLPD